MGAVICLIGAQAEAHIQRLVHPALVLGSDLAGPLPQAVFIQRAYLLQQHDAVLGKARIFGPDVDVGGKPGFVQPGCNGGCNDRGAVPVAISFCTMSTGRTPPCSEPTTGERSA